MINHAIFNIPLAGELPEKTERILFAMGCFWGVEKCFWQLNVIYRTTVGYAGGSTEKPSYQQVCTGSTGHAEVVEVIYYPEIISTKDLLEIFWENHDPTQGMWQGNDRGTQYRSMIICNSDLQMQLALETRDIYQQQLSKDGHATISTEIVSAQDYYLAEEYHQQYLVKNPDGYCSLKGTGTCF